jgi:hypothetical protein
MPEEVKGRFPRLKPRSNGVPLATAFPSLKRRSLNLSPATMKNTSFRRKKGRKRDPNSHRVCEMIIGYSSTPSLCIITFTFITYKTSESLLLRSKRHDWGDMSMAGYMRIARALSSCRFRRHSSIATLADDIVYQNG